MEKEMIYETLYTKEDILNDVKFREMSLNELADIINWKVSQDVFISLKISTNLNTHYGGDAKEIAKALRLKWEKELNKT